MEIADWGGEPEGSGLYLEATVTWSEPLKWATACPASDALGDCYLYALGHRRIEYIGLTTTGRTRFARHNAADDLRSRGKPLYLSQGNVSFNGPGARKAANEYRKNALEQIEHILIWAVPKLTNQRKMEGLPLLGSSDLENAAPWVIRNEGHAFSGEMPKKIVYPWMLVEER